MGAASAVVAAAPALVPSLSGAGASDVGVAAAGAARGFAAGNYAIEIDGLAAGWVMSAEGGQATADVVTEKIGGDGIQKKHIGNVKYEDISITFGVGMGKALYDWVQASFDHKVARKNGAVIAADYNYREQSRLNFFNALITEIGLPALDAASKDAAKMTVKFAPESTQRSPGKGDQLRVVAKQKAWLVSNFRLGIDGLDCQRVNKVEALTIKQKIVENPVGEGRTYGLEIPNLVITLPEASAESFYAWHEDFVIGGNNSDKNEKNGRLDWLTPDGRFSLGTVEFRNLGIFKLTPDKLESGSDGIRRVKAEMYCEDMLFKFNATSV